MKKVLITIGLLFIMVNSSCTSRKIQVSCGISETSQIGINHLQPLIDAAEKYKVDNGKYPTEETKDFVPKYIDKIPIFNCTGSDAGILPIHNVLQNEKLCGGQNMIAKDGSYFKMEFYSTDDRVCLLGGRNNICEYTSEKKVWSCYQ